MKLVRISYMSKGGKMFAMHKHHISCLLWPFAMLWHLLAMIVGLTGRFIAMILGLVFMGVGLIVSLTLIGAIVGIPMMVVGLLLFLKGLF